MTSMMIMLLAATTFAAGGYGGGMGGMGMRGTSQGGYLYTFYDDTQVNHQAEIDALPIEELSQEEIDGLLLMREEEKLARDVYLELYDKWGIRIFSNIASSEQTHTDAVKSLLDKYDLEDPVGDDARGVFENQELQTLYISLVEQGSNSIEDALTIGATIEDLDIKDLQDLLEQTDNQDITAVYNNLMKGSRNHLRSFTRMLGMYGESYEAQFITEDYYNEILGNDMETGMQYDSMGMANQVNTQGKNQLNTQTNNQNLGNGRQANQDFVPQLQEQEPQSRGVFARMWNGFKSWFS